MRRYASGGCCRHLAMLAAAPAAQPQDVDSSGRAVTVEGIHEHQKALQGIADLNGGNRYTRTAGYTASAAYVKATLEKAGYDARYSMFNMPMWHEDAPPVLQLTSPTSKTYVPGNAEDDGSTERRLHRVRALADQVGVRRGHAGRPHGRPVRRRQHERLRRGGLPGPTSRARSR